MSNRAESAERTATDKHEFLGDYIKQLRTSSQGVDAEFEHLDAEMLNIMVRLIPEDKLKSPIAALSSVVKNTKSPHLWKDKEALEARDEAMTAINFLKVLAYKREISNIEAKLKRGTDIAVARLSSRMAHKRNIPQGQKSDRKNIDLSIGKRKRLVDEKERLGACLRPRLKYQPFDIV